MATERQANYILGLRDGKDLSSLSQAQRDWLAKLTEENLKSLSTESASKVISSMVDLPWIPKTSAPNQQHQSLPHPDIKDGRYAITDNDGTLKFYSVKRWEKNPNTIFVDVWASDDRWPIKDRNHREEILTKIENDPDAGPRFGREIGKCYVCGRTLTDELSRQLGIGPICREGY